MTLMIKKALKRRGLPSAPLLTNLENYGILLAMVKQAQKGPGKIFFKFSKYLLTNTVNCSIISLSLSLSLSLILT
jgi:hypothetical protein